MRWQTVKKLRPEQFKRLVDVEYETFEKMVSEAKRISSIQPKKVAGKKRGPKEKVNWYDKTLMLLMYYREYRTFAHIGSTYNISETQCWRIITPLETWLVKIDLLRLPEKKKLTQSDMEWDIVVVDVSEHAIERPKKNSADTIQVRRKSTP
jgi:hypothetical protein